MRLAILFSFTLSFFSCNLKKEIVYFQNNQNSIDSTTSSVNNTTKIKYDDIVAVDVSALDPETVKIFYRDIPISMGGQQTMYTNGIAARGGYLVDANGQITLPIIGKQTVANLSAIEASTLIQEQLKNYVADPLVSIRILNFKVTVLGDVRSPGTFTIPNERITLPEALGLSGDLNITGVRKNILVIREENGHKKQYRIDLTDASSFSSPVFYLQQNDIVYVEPNRAKRNSSLVSSTAGIFISVASLIITTINLISR